jgi:Flp pilus assembly protein TadG
VPEGCDRFRAGERATAAVEFALVLPLILVMTLAVVEVGLLVKDRLVLQGAARAGAREAAVSADDGEVRQSVIDAAASLDGSGIDVDVTREGGVGSAVTVTVVYHDTVAIPLVDWLFPSEIELGATAVMRQETS